MQEKEIMGLFISHLHFLFVKPSQVNISKQLHFKEHNSIYERTFYICFLRNEEM